MQFTDPAAPARAAGICRPVAQGTRTFPFSLVFALVACVALSACGTLTGIPSHGGGKRFATEQRLVDGWELKFAPPRQPGQLPSLIHALPR